MSDIKIGSKVTAPVTDKDGEVSYIIGLLIDMNSRYATVEQSDGTITKVGKSKIDIFAAPEPKPTKVDHSICKKCKNNLKVFDFNNVKRTADVNTAPYNSMTNRFWCSKCKSAWGASLRKSVECNIDARAYGYEPCRAASGRKSLDNGDATALKLRGMTLDQVYAEASIVLSEDESVLRAKYAHLNVGQQRMNLGNRIRKATRMQN